MTAVQVSDNETLPDVMRHAWVYHAYKHDATQHLTLMHIFDSENPFTSGEVPKIPCIFEHNFIDFSSLCRSRSMMSLHRNTVGSQISIPKS